MDGGIKTGSGKKTRMVAVNNGVGRKMAWTRVTAERKGRDGRDLGEGTVLDGLNGWWQETEQSRNLRPLLQDPRLGPWGSNALPELRNSQRRGAGHKRGIALGAQPV